MINFMMPNQDLRLFPSQETLVRTQIHHLLLHEIGSYQILYPTSSKLVGSWYFPLVGFMRYSTASRVSSCYKIWIFQVSPQGASLIWYSRVENWGWSAPFWYLKISPGDRCPMDPSSWAQEALMRHQTWVLRSFTRQFFLLGGSGSEVGSA